MTPLDYSNEIRKHSDLFGFLLFSKTGKLVFFKNRKVKRKSRFKLAVSVDVSQGGVGASSFRCSCAYACDESWLGSCLQ